MSELTVKSHIVIVGAGLAGDRCAFALRGAGFEGSITLVGAEPVRPYDRPPLSKAVLKAAGEENNIFYRAEADYADARIDLLLGRAVAAVDPHRRTIRIGNDGELRYDILVLATGSRLRTLPDLPVGAPGVFYLRGRDDALRLRQAFEAGGRIAVIGGGVIGMEAAAAGVSRGLPVTVIEPEAHLMARACGPTVSEWLTRRHGSAGVIVRCGAPLQSAVQIENGYRLVLGDKSVVEAEIIIVGVGVSAETTLAADAGLDVAPGGVIVDGHGRTSDPAIYAAGEVAFHYNARAGGHERQENWYHAAAHGEHVGRAILSPGAEYAELSGFWTDQYELSLHATGRTLAERDVVRGEIADGRVIVFHLEGEVMVGASGINAASELRQAKALIRSRTLVDPAKLANPDVKISEATA